MVPVIIFFIIIVCFVILTSFMPVILPAFANNALLLPGILLLAVVIYIISVYNSFKRKKLQIDQAQKGIDIYLKQRFDLIPNLVEVVKGYKNYEKEVLKSLVNIRNEAARDTKINEKARLNNEYNKVIAIVESYPELKANEAFLNLQKQLSKMESQLQAARRIFNVEVTEYNTKVATVPSNLIAKMFGFKPEKLFEIEDDERANINIKV